MNLEKAEKPEIKLPTSAGSQKKQEFQKNIYLCFIDYTTAFDCVDQNKHWKILKEIRIPDHHTCFQGSVQAGQDTVVGTEQGIMNWYKIRKEIHQGDILSSSLFDFCAEYFTESNLLKEIEAGNKITLRSKNNLSYKMTTHKWLKNTRN